MSGLGSGRCGAMGCENPCPRDEDFCCTGCEALTRAEDFEAHRAADPACSLCEAGHVPAPRYELRVGAPGGVPAARSEFGADWPLTWREVREAWDEALASPGAGGRVYTVVEAAPFRSVPWAAPHVQESEALRSVHTCHAGCPCHSGGEPRPDFES